MYVTAACLKSARWVFFYNLKQLESIFVILPNNILKIIASKRMHNFPPHLSRVTTLPENTLATDRHVVFLRVGGSKKIMDDGDAPF